MAFGINQTIVKNGTTAEVSVTTDSFTATAGKLLTARGSCYAGSGDDTSTVSITDSQSHTWEPINERSQNDDGGALNPPPVKAWWTVAAGGSMTVTTTRVNAVGFAHVCVVREWNDADTDDPIAAIAEGSATTNPVTASLDTTGVDGAIGCFESVDWGETANVPSEDADTTLDYAIANADIQGSFSGHRAFGAGGTYTLGTDSPSTGDFNWIAYAVRPAATGTEFTKSLGGTVTPTGALTRSDSKTVTGAVTPAAALAKTLQRALAAAVTPSGATVKAAGKPLGGTVAPAGTALKVLSRILGGTTTPAGAIAKQTALAFGGTATPTGGITKSAGKALAGAITPSASLLKLLSKLLGGTVTPAGTLTSPSITDTLPGFPATSTRPPTGAAATSTRGFGGG